MNEWRISEALRSSRRLDSVLDQMTEDEIVKVIAVEEASSRRKSLLGKLYRQHRVLSRKHQRETIRHLADQQTL